ncbi:MULTISPECIES: hypothetical protein [unclassified Paracoccus (in: a-proteobacteria)]|uniref:hypothetical protein n=1 Tax=unclassified Paracoccus (in: a-proteobacteria) TaxID=2688777 RepID=UPI0016014AB7|nr:MULTISPECIES: hypothetical protein [unclassified Paracoccus (in: a-proteobacteria)]MBB1493188.1 hypothetical protein [Paracoccus sp. MC1854]MBB1499452.1 hypothetical protein [Paracoccus sp. MC1862]QQO45115.1 hypothetical protein JGR78_01545 [Paracoccus sp. MC1862]
MSSVYDLTNQPPWSAATASKPISKQSDQLEPAVNLSGIEEVLARFPVTARL